MAILFFLISGYSEVISVQIPDRAPLFVTSINNLGIGPTEKLFIYTNPLVDLVAANISTKVTFNFLSFSVGVMFPYPEYLFPLFIKDENIEVSITGNLFWLGFSLGGKYLSINTKYISLGEKSSAIFDMGGLLPLSKHIDFMYQTGIGIPLSFKYGLGFNIKFTDNLFMKIGLKDSIKDMGYECTVMPYFDFGYVVTR